MGAYADRRHRRARRLRRDARAGRPLPGHRADAVGPRQRLPGRALRRSRAPRCGDPAGAVLQAARRDPWTAPRFTDARTGLAPAAVLGPMAHGCRRCPGAAGLLLAGDAAGFIDPMTGDGIRLALAGAEIAADVADAVLCGRLAAADAATVLARRRRQAFARQVDASTARCAAWSASRRAARCDGAGAVLAAGVRGDGLLRRRRRRRGPGGGDVPLALSIAARDGARRARRGWPARRRLSAHNAAVLHRARRRRARRRRLSGDAVGLSARLRGDGRRRRADRPGAADGARLRPGAVRRGQGPEGVGDRVARPALDLPSAGAAGCAARHRMALIG